MITHRIRLPFDTEGSVTETVTKSRLRIEERFAMRASTARARWFVVLRSHLPIARIVFSRSRRAWLARPIGYDATGEEYRSTRPPKVRHRNHGIGRSHDSWIEVPRGIIGNPTIRRWGDLVLDRDALLAFAATLPIPIHRRAAKKGTKWR